MNSDPPPAASPASDIAGSRPGPIYEDALRNADSLNDLRLAIKLNSKEAKNRDITSGIEHLNIV